MDRTRATLLYMFICIALFGRGTITQGNQGTEGYTAKRTQKQEEQHTHEVHCSRERSRAAWKIIEEKLSSRLQHGGLGSSCAVRRVNTSGIWTSLRKSALLPQAEDFHTLPPSAALNPSLQPENQCGAACCKLGCSCAAEGSGPTWDVLTGEVVWNSVIREVVKQIKGSLVCLAVCRGVRHWLYSLGQ